MCYRFREGRTNRPSENCPREDEIAVRNIRSTVTYGCELTVQLEKKATGF